MAHWTQVSDCYPFGCLFWIYFTKSTWEQFTVSVDQFSDGTSGGQESKWKVTKYLFAFVS